MTEGQVILKGDTDLSNIFDDTNLLVSDRMFIPIGAHSATFTPNADGSLPIKTLTRDDGKKLYLLACKVNVFGTTESVNGEVAINSKTALMELQKNLSAKKYEIHVRAKHSKDGECYTNLVTASQASIMYKTQTTSAVNGTVQPTKFSDLSEEEQEKFLDSLSRKDAKEYEENPNKELPAEFELTA
jgi:hypothetical protein